MNRPSSARHRELAAEVWRRLFDFLIATSGQRQRVLAELDLTPNDSRALHTLDPTEGRTMRSLADAWGCDASNATWIVDRLEARGLAERRAKPGDRRVKLVVLTPDGLRTRQRLQQGMYEPPPALLALSAAELRALRSATAPLRSDSVEL